MDPTRRERVTIAVLDLIAGNVAAARDLAPDDAADLVDCFGHGFVVLGRRSRKGVPPSGLYYPLCGRVFTAETAAPSGALAAACEGGDVASLSRLLAAGALRPAEGGVDPESPLAREALEAAEIAWAWCYDWTYDADNDLSPAENAAQLEAEEASVDHARKRLRRVAAALHGAGVPPTPTSLRMVMTTGGAPTHAAIGE